MKSIFLGIFFAFLLTRIDAGVTAFRTGDELIVKIDRFDLLRQQHDGLKAELRLVHHSTATQIRIDLADPAVAGALVIDLAKLGACEGIEVTIRNSADRVLVSQTVSPIPNVELNPVKFTGPPRQAYIEPGTGLRGLEAPRIALPDLREIRTVRLGVPDRLVAKDAIKFPVVADVDHPVIGGVVVGRQTAAPRDPAKASLYFSGKKAIYNGSRVERWQKFLVEVPVAESWGSGQGDELVVLRPDQFEVHLTNEKSPAGKNMLNDKEGDLGQLGEVDADDEGRIYWRIDGGGGAYVVRFNPFTKRFEQPPVQVDFQKLVPAGAGLLNDGLCKISCTRGRVFFTMCNDTLSSGEPGNANRRRIGGVFSISQDWSDAARFQSEIRLHAGSWETARPTLYGTPPKADAVVRKLGACSVTETGLFITTAEPKYEGGPWRLDLDDKGNTTFFGTVKSVNDSTAADGTRLLPTKIVTIKGIPKGRELNVGPGGGRSLVGFNAGEVTLPRASVRLLIHGVEGVTLVKLSKHVTTYEGAPQGTVTLRYDLVGKLKTHPEARGALADSLSGGLSMGPAFLLSPVPGDASRVVAVCEYAGYPLSILDFSRREETKTVARSPLPPQIATRAGLGPYDSIWVSRADELWLYMSGYTGLSRILYSKGGRVQPAIVADVFNGRLAQRSVDGHSRTSMKKIDGLLPVFGGRLIDSGYGIGGRGGDAFSTGVELFDPSLLGEDQDRVAPSQTSAHLSRCFALRTLQSRMVWNGLDGVARQEVFAASGSVRRQMINELQDPSLAPANLDAKIFLYEVTPAAGLRDLYGFSLPAMDSGQATEGHIVLSPCRRFLVILTQDGVLYSYSIARKQFIDASVLQSPSGGSVRLMEFKRPSQIIFTAPDGQIFFLAEPSEQNGESIHFHRVLVGDNGRLGVTPHLGITYNAAEGYQDFKGIVRCFQPDLVRRDGSYDFILGYSQSTVEPFVRIITDFIASQDGQSSR